jgi:hypothetical protein
MNCPSNQTFVCDKEACATKKDAAPMQSHRDRRRGERLSREWDAGEQFGSDRQRGLSHQRIDLIAFGDLFLEDIKKYRDDFLCRHNLSGIYPIWKQTESLFASFATWVQSCGYLRRRYGARSFVHAPRY